MAQKVIYTLVLITISMFMLLSFSCSKKEEETKKAEITQSEEKIVKIGVIYPLTGNASYWGENALNGAILAKEDFIGENFLKDKKVEYIIEDSKSSTKNAINAAKKLIYQDNVKFILGDLVSSNLLAMAPICEENKVLTIGQGSNPKLKHAGKYIFRTWPSDDFQGKVLADFIKNNTRFSSEKSLIFLYVANEYGRGVVQEIKKYFPKEDLKEFTYSPSTKDFKNILAKIKNETSKVIIMVSYPEELSIILEQMKEQNINKTIIGTETFKNEKILKKSLPFEIYFSFPKFSSSNDTKYLNFVKNYKEKFKKEPGVPADVVYDSAMLVLKGIDKYGYNPDKVRSYLLNIKNYKGVSGIINFDKNGDVIKPFTIYRFFKGKLKIVEEINLAR